MDTHVFLNRQLIHLGEMMGDGLHREPGGEWIEREYRKILVAQGIVPKRKRPDPQEVNARMAQRTKDVQCTCGGNLKQTRSGSTIAKCRKCGNRYQLLKRKKMRRE